MYKYSVKANLMYCHPFVEILPYLKASSFSSGSHEIKDKLKYDKISSHPVSV